MVGPVRVVAVLAALATAACGPAEPENLSERIDAIVESAMAEGPIAGVSVSIARGVDVLHEKGYGYADLEHRVPVTPETVFRIGSITKQFTAASVVQLADDGALSLDDRLTEYLPDYPGPASEVTVADLLSHTSGIPNYTTMDRWWETLTHETSPRGLISSFEDEPFDFPPGTRFSYSNSGYVVLGWIAEQVSGRPFGGLLNANLFAPLDLEQTRYCGDRAVIPNRARGYRALDGDFLHADYFSSSQAYAAGAVCSTAPDLVRWSLLLSTGLALGRDGYRAMSTPATLRDGTTIEYGYGMAIGYVEGHRRVSHVGGVLGFAGQIAHYDEDDLTVVVLTNTEGAKAANIEVEIARLVLGLGDEVILDVALAAEEAQRYVGTYDLSLTTVGVDFIEGRLRAEVDVPGLRGSYPLLYQGDGRFVAEHDSEIAVAFGPPDGPAQEFVLTHKGLTMHGERISG